MTLALAFAIFSSARRRSEPDEADTELQGLALAETGRRFAAGLIDAVPFIVPLIFFTQLVHLNGADMQDPSTAAHDLTMLTLKTGMAAFAVYLLHTAVSEALTGRTLGKMLLGLRVVRLDGGTPDVYSLLIRNLLRLVDVGPFGLPLMLILFSPLADWRHRRRHRGHPRSRAAGRQLDRAGEGRDDVPVAPRRVQTAGARGRVNYAH